MYHKNKVIELGGNRYKLDHNIGNGGSGVVWLIQSEEGKFAIKFINSSNTDKITRFKSEILFCTNHTHRNIVQVIVDGEYDNKPCYVMRYYPKTLRDVINEENDVDILIKYILNICDAVKYIHKKEIKHRDIKPENILIDGKELVLADFGIAHFKNSDLTKKGDLLANRNYLAPEQRIKNNATNIDIAADIYALGLIINECFTKHNPAGSKFKLIAGSYPLFSDIDTLVENMIRQNPEDRLNIDTVIAELKFIHRKVTHDLKAVRSILSEQGHRQTLNKSIVNKIFNKASEDVLFGKHLFSAKSRDEIKKFNLNWHMKIGYSVDDFLFSLYVQEQIFSLCKGKFDYESNVYRETNWYNTLDLKNNTKHKSLYRQLAVILAKYDLHMHGASLLDLSGSILHYFSSCADYHCEEILRAIIKVETEAVRNLNNAPIIWIVSILKNGITENIDLLLNGFDGLAGKYKFDFSEHVTINWSQTEDYLKNEDDVELFDKHYLEVENEVQRILLVFQQKWNITSNKLDGDFYSIKFKTYNQFEKFRKYALELSQPHYIFEGDVLDFLGSPNFVGGIVELTIRQLFDIPNTLAKIIGLRKIED